LIGARTDTWAAVQTGGGYTCGLRIDQSLYCWGYNDVGQLGTGDTTDRLVPTQIDPGSSWLNVDTGPWYFEGHTCAVAADHTLWCWGSNMHGELGTGDKTDRIIPTQVDDSPHWLSTTGGIYYQCGSRDDGTLWCWGWNQDGELGIGSTYDQLNPTQVGARRSWTMIVAGLDTTCAARQDRNPAGIWCWGSNSYGSVGDGTQFSRLSPVRITISSGR
jgi:alpha-tubulin suppressor-like RCC1 family protein